MKPASVKKIENLLGRKLYPAPEYQTGLMAFRNNYPKYALDEKGTLVGLNLATMDVDDAKWQAIEDLLAQERILLSELNLEDNQLTKFELSAGTQSLNELGIEGNQIQNVPEGTMKQGAAAILRFLKNIKTQGEKKLYEVKLLLVGEGEAGKTTLWNLLQNPRYKVEDGKIPSTVGIQIKEGWKFKHIDLPKEAFIVNLWDFGGQEIQYMTHQFFLTTRSFYILLANGRQESPNFSYWLRIIETLGCEEGTEQRLPVLVVLNKKGVANPKALYDVTTVEEDYPRLEIIKEELDFKTEKDKVSTLINKIKRILCRDMAHLPIPFPAYWKGVREELYRMRMENIHHIDAAEFKRICKVKGIPEDDEQQRNDLSQLLHDLGIIVHFWKVNQLADFIVLNPQWAVNAVYEIMKHEVVKNENQGRFDDALLKKIWAKYSEKERGALLNLMLKGSLDVCFEVKEQGRTVYIAPQLLPENKPDNIDWKETMDTLRYVYHYPFMPKGLIGRLIVHLSDIDNIDSDVDNRRLVWEKGVVLRMENCRAQVQQLYDRDKGRDIIKIEVQGADAENRKNVLRDIRKELDGLHRDSFPSLKVFQKVPCNCEECKESPSPYEHDYDKILKFKNKNGDEALSQCGNSGESIRVQQLLDGVFKNEEMGGGMGQKGEPGPIHYHKHYYNGNNGNMQDPNSNSPTNNPDSLFAYLAALVIVAGVIIVLLNVVDIYKALVGIVAIVILLVMLGALQLRNDDKLSEKSFLDLMFVVLKKIPPLNLFFK